jgi:hypothetical protein
MAAVQVNPQCASYLALFRRELRTASTPATAYHWLDHWVGVTRGLHMAGAISGETRELMSEAILELADAHASVVAERIKEQIHAPD